MAKWSRREKYLLFVTFLFTLVAAVTSVLLGIKYHEDKNSDETSGQLATKRSTLPLSTPTPLSDQVCFTESCVVTSAALLNAMDQTVDPCDDFFKYSCGNWNKKHIIPEDKSALSRFNEVRDSVQAKLKAVIENNNVGNIEDGSEAIKKTKLFYFSCMNESAIEQHGRAELEQQIIDLGGWPLRDASWTATGFQLESILANYSLAGSSYIIRTSVQPDDKNTSAHTILIDQGSLFMGARLYYLSGNDSISVKAYYNLAIAVAQKFGAKNPEKDVRDVIDFEIQLANMTSPASERRDGNKLYNKYTIKSFDNQLSTQFGLKKYLYNLFHQYYNILEDDTIIVYEPEYIENVAKLLNATPKRTIANYLMTRFVIEKIPYLSEEYRLLSQEYDRIMVGKKHAGERWRTCLTITASYFPVSLGRMFVDHYFDERAKSEAMTLIHNIRKSFTEIINETTWMDDTTKQRAFEKVEALRERIAYPDWIKDNKELDEEYDQVEVQSDHFMENVLEKRKYDVTRNFKKINETVNKDKWYDGASIVNAFYNPNLNSITFPAGILQPPFYNEDYPKSLIYGGIGLVIGHEITHGFDDQGRQYDKDGNLKSWWTNSSSENFNELAQCIIDQYSNFTIGNDHIKGQNTQGENIADNGGINVAYRAYQKWLGDNSEEYAFLPALNLTHDQLFFLNFAQGWCGVRTPAAQHKQILSDPHSPGRYRIIGTLSNSEDFSRAYNCKKGTTMNPDKKCRVW